MRNRNIQRGEGKVGCMVSLLVLGILIAAAVRILPVLFSNNDFANSIENIASRAGILPQATIELQIRDKARELNIPEAMAAGAVVVTKFGDHMSGTCTVKVHYTRKIDFYGLYAYPLETNTTRNVLYMDAR
ncbi:MAG: hypothetical protein WAT51_05430 [Holophaga sp.]